MYLVRPADPTRLVRDMPTYQFEAMDSTGQEIKDVIEAPTEAEAQWATRFLWFF